MQALGLVRMSKEQNVIEISFNKISECKKIGLGRVWGHSGSLKAFEHHGMLEYRGVQGGFKRGP